MADPTELIAARYIVDYLNATRHYGKPVKERIDALEDLALVAGLLNKECIDAYALAKAHNLFEKALNRIMPTDVTDFG